MSKHLTLYDFRDIDLMLKLEDAAGEDGASSNDLASALGMEDDVRNVAIRCAWMRRYGIFDFDGEKRLWRLSESGRRVAEAKLRAAAATQIERVPDEAMVDVMAHVTTRYRLGDPVLATMLRREFLFGTSRRSSVWNGGRKG
jgi:hypothetical protein